jgi:sentrin-specific protease 1
VNIFPPPSSKFKKQTNNNFFLLFFIELNEEQQRLIINSLIPYPEDEILSKGFNIDVRRKDLQTLKGLNWLNDEVINFYMNLICARSETLNDLLAYPFATFFYPRLIKDGHQGVRRWTKKVDIFTYNLIIVPIHLGMHWTLAVCVTTLCQTLKKKIFPQN